MSFCPQACQASHAAMQRAMVVGKTLTRDPRPSSTGRTIAEKAGPAGSTSSILVQVPGGSTYQGDLVKGAVG